MLCVSDYVSGTCVKLVKQFVYRLYLTLSVRQNVYARSRGQVFVKFCEMCTLYGVVQVIRIFGMSMHLR